jgi:hypothetical protein
MTVGELRSVLRGIPDGWHIRPQWQPGCTPADNEPGVELHGLAVDEDMEQVVARVSLFYLDEEYDDAGD